MPFEVRPTLSTVILFIIFAFILSGCYSTKPGKVVNTKRTGEEIERKYYKVKKFYNEKSVDLKIEVGYIKRVGYEEKAKKLKRERHLGWPIFLTNGISSLLYCRSDAFKVSYGLCIGTMSFVGAIAGGVSDMNWGEDEYDWHGGYMNGGDYTRKEKEYGGNMSNKYIVVENNKELSYKTDSWGSIRVRYDEIIRSKKANDDKYSEITLSTKSGENIGTVKIDKRKWMVPYARLTKAAEVKKRRSYNSDVIEEVRPGQEFRIKNTKGNWAQVGLSEREGWVPTSSIDRLWFPPTKLDPNSLPSVTASLEFKEPSGNGRLEGDETAKVEVTVQNEGEGPAHRVRAALKPTELPNLSYPSLVEFGKVAPGSSIKKTIHIEANRNISSEKVALTFHFHEANGFAPNPLRLQFRTREFIPPELTIADVGIDDASGNGIINPGEVVEVTARVRNASRGRAENVRADINFGEDVFAGPDTRQSFDLGNLGPGEHRDIRFSLVTSQQAESVPVTVKLSEEYGEFGNSIKLPLSFDQPTDQITEVQVEGQDTEVAVKAGDQLSVDVETNIPTTSMDRPDAIAVVIGIRDYSSEGVPDVEYARRDARIMRQYLTKTLGFHEENILPRKPDGRMTYAELRTLIRQKLPGYVKEGTSEVFVFYSGHGAPTTGENRRAYLVPSDTDPNFVSDDNAYRLSQFYKDLANLNAKSVTVALDACFTGQSGSGEMMIRQASPAVLSVENPFLAIENGTAFLASSSEQVANWYSEKKHGMFTYFFLKGLKGAADQNDDQQLTVREMEAYLTDSDSGVPYWSRRVHQRKQTPQVVGRDKDQVLVRYGEKVSEENR